MIAILDAAYGETRAAAACVVARSWDAATAAAERSITGGEASPYEPGQLYKRELALLLGVIPIDLPITFAVVDGYVSLGPELAPGLGARLHDALGGKVPVIGVAKTEFAHTPAEKVMRGRSERPLHVTSIGINPGAAADLVRQMHGEFRMPSLIKRADQLARLALASVSPN